MVCPDQESSGLPEPNQTPTYTTSRVTQLIHVVRYFPGCSAPYR